MILQKSTPNVYVMVLHHMYILENLMWLFSFPDLPVVTINTAINMKHSFICGKLSSYKILIDFV
jgi:hypothetical protein